MGKYEYHIPLRAGNYKHLVVDICTLVPFIESPRVLTYILFSMDMGEW